MVFTFSIWLILQLSKSYTYTTSVKLKIKDLPVEIEQQESRINIAFDLTGFQILSKLKFGLTIEIEASNVDIKENLILLPENEILSQAKTQLGLHPDTNLSLNTTEISLVRNEKKSIQLIVERTVNYKEGYNSLDGLKMDTNEVEVTAPNFILDTLTKLKVKPLVINQLDESKKGKLKIINPNQDLIKLSSDFVNYEIDVQEFTEKRVNTVFQVVNLPENYSLITFPETVELQFQVPLSTYSSVHASDFEVVVDFNERLEDQSLLLPRLKRFPKKILNPKVKPRTIDYLIKFEKDE